MRFKTIASIAAILTFVNAAFFLLAPGFSLFLLGRETNPTGIMSTRISGACALGLGLITWLARDTGIPQVRRLVSYGMLTAFGVLVVIDLAGILSGAVNSVGWLIFFADLSLSTGFLLSIFTDRGQPR
jgi:Na+/H+ antiporter NhaC